MNTSYPKAIELRKKPVDDCVLVHDAIHSKVHVLNTTAAMILNFCDGNHSTTEITEKLAAETGMKAREIASDVDAVLAQFHELEILEPTPVGAGASRS